MNDSMDPYELKENVLGENMQVDNAKIESNGIREYITPLDLVKIN